MEAETEGADTVCRKAAPQAFSGQHESFPADLETRVDFGVSFFPDIGSQPAAVGHPIGNGPAAGN